MPPPALPPSPSLLLCLLLSLLGLLGLPLGLLGLPGLPLGLLLGLLSARLHHQAQQRARQPPHPGLPPPSLPVAAARRRRWLAVRRSP